MESTRKKRATIYMCEKLMVMLDIRNSRNVSTDINKFICRYAEIVKRNIPYLSAEEFEEIFTVMDKFQFSADVLVDTLTLPSILEVAGVCKETGDKVGKLSFEERISLIDLIERSQGGHSADGVE